MVGKINWKTAVILPLIAGVVTFLVFLLYQVIFGDILHEIFAPFVFESAYYLVCDIILLIGLFVVFIVAYLVNILIYRNYTYQSKLKANTFALLGTILILFICGMVSAFLIFPDLNAFQVLSIFMYYYIIFAIYILPSPVWFWYIAIIIYTTLLIIFYKILLVPSVKIPKRYKKIKKRKVYRSRVI